MNVSPGEKSTSRSLIYFPIVHNQADMGAFSESIRQASLERLGRSGWKRKLEVIDRFWTEIEQTIDRFSLSFSQVRIYQDGLPVSGREVQIVEELARAGSRNYALLQRLIRRGAKVVGTESLELLLEEYELVKKALGPGRASGARRTEKSSSASLLRRRDKFIAKRINDTLLPGEVGIVFLGMLHSLGPWLDKDIQVTYPMHRPPQSKESAGEAQGSAQQRKRRGK
ncbi:MAG: hypothetical protein ACOYXY_17100 [Thermodesulfobacteriota bacterium]